MCFNHRRFAIGALLFACSFLSAGCSDYGSGKSGAGASYQTISGIASKGPISGATVTVYQRREDGTRGAVLGVTRSLRDGSYRLSIPATSGPVVVVATGDNTAKYIDEITGVEKTFKDQLKDGLQAAVPDVSKAKSIAVTPFTDAAVRAADGWSNKSLTQAEKIKSANATVSNVLGLDIVATIPNNIGKKGGQIIDINYGPDKYGAYLAGIQFQTNSKGPTATVDDTIKSLATPVIAGNELGKAGGDFLAAVGEVLKNTDLNPTGITSLPRNDSERILDAINRSDYIVDATPTTPPAPPADLRIDPVLNNAQTAKLTWTASTSADTVGYMVYRNNEVIAEVQSPIYFDSTIVASASYSYAIVAINAARNNVYETNNTTPGTTPFTLQPAAQADTTRPSEVSSLAASDVSSNSVTLIWNPSTDNIGVTGYFIFRDGQKIASVPDPGYTDTSVAPNTTYRYQIQAFDAAGNFSAAMTASLIGTLPVPNAADTTPPTTPTGLAVTKTSSSVTLTWNPSTDNVGVVGYGIYRNTQLLDTVKLPGYTDGTVAANAAYTYKIQAYDAAGNSAYGSEVSVTTDAVQNPTDTAPPAAPAGLVSPNFTKNSVNLAWSASTDNDRVAGYNIFRDGAKIATVTQAGYSDTSLSAGTQYTYKVNAFDPTGNVSDYSTELTITTLPELVVIDGVAPSQPTNLAASGITERSVSLTWTASSDNVGVVRYDVYRDGNIIGSVTALGVTDAIGLAPITTYKYKIKALDAAGNASPFSAELSVTTLTSYDITPPAAPAGLAASSIEKTSLTLSWGASTDDRGVVRYDVYRNGAKAGFTDGSIRTYPDTALSPGSTYTYKVQAFDGAGNFSPFSAEFAVDTRTNIEVTVGGQIGSGIIGLPSLDITPPSAPTNLAATTFSTSATQSSVVLTWTASTDNTGVAGYDVYRLAGSANTKIATVVQPGYTVAGAPSGTAFSYFVIAFDAAGNRSPVSNQLSVTPTQVSLGVTVGGQIGSGIIGLPSLDVTAPSAPTGLAATTFSTSSTQSSVVLTWNASTDNTGVAGYEVYRVTAGASAKIGTVVQPGYTVTLVASGTLSTYFVIAFDAAGNRSIASSQLSVTPTQVSLGVTVGGQIGSGIIGLPSLDVTAPSAPTGLAATTFSTSSTQSSVVLTWNASTDNTGVAGYEVYRVAGGASAKIGTVVQPGCTVTGATSGTPSTYFVIAYDAAGNRSVPGNQLSVTPTQVSLGVTVGGQIGSGIIGLPSLDVTAPSAPTGLAATTFSTSSTQSSVVLTWNASTDNTGVAGYEIYQVAAGASAKIGTAAQPGYTVTGVASGALSTYFVIAYDAAGNRSAAGNQLSVTPAQVSLGVTVGGQIGSGIIALPSL